MVKSYFGLRSITLAPPAILLNGKPVFQRLVLDQGFYPEGIYTAPSDEALRRDIELAQAVGYNGARLHQKVFEERTLYWADRLGYIVWGEFPSWGVDPKLPGVLERFLPEWLEVLERDYSHPCLVGWCPFNETKPDHNPEVLRNVYLATKAVDRTRPVIDASGWTHVVCDVYDSHDYDQRTEAFAQRHGRFASGGEPFVNNPKDAVPWQGQPYFVSEYGGIWWNPGQTDEKAWGYGERPRTHEEFMERFRALTETLLKNPRMCGLCYTQLTDVEQEVNGIYTYDRQAKHDAAALRAINAQKAAIEEA